MVAVDLRATVGTRGLGDRRPEVDGYLPSYLRNRGTFLLSFPGVSRVERSTPGCCGCDGFAIFRSLRLGCLNLNNSCNWFQAGQWRWESDAFRQDARRALTQATALQGSDAAVRSKDLQARRKYQWRLLKSPFVHGTGSPIFINASPRRVCDSSWT